MDRMFKRLGLLPLALFAPVAAAAEPALPAASTLPLDFSRPLEIGVEVQGMDAEARVNELSQYLDQQGFELRLKLDYRIREDATESGSLSVGGTRTGTISPQQLDAVVARVADLADRYQGSTRWSFVQLPDGP